MGEEERFRKELLRLTAGLRPQLLELKTEDVERGQVEDSSYAVIEEELRRLREAALLGHTVRRIRHSFNDLLVGIHWRAESLSRGSNPGDEVHKAAKAVSDTARRTTELMQQWRGFDRGAVIRDDPLDVHGAAEDAAAAPGVTTDKRDEVPAGMPERGRGRILVVDDEDGVRDVVEQMLTSMGYAVACVRNGREAVDHYREHGDDVSLVLLDLTMPVMNGWYCFRELKGIDPGVKVLLSTGHAFDGVVQGLLDEGVAGVVQKPFVRAKLSEAVAGALQPAGSPAEETTAGDERVQPFVNETIRTFELMLGVTPEKEGEKKKESAGSAYDLSGAVGISGPATGGVVLSLPRDVACRIASRILCEQVDETSPDVIDCTAELVNVISARAKRALSRRGFPDLRLSLAQVVVGKGRFVWLSRDLPCVSVSFVTEEFGPFCIEISIRPVGERGARQAAVAEGAAQYGPGATTHGPDAGEGRTSMKILLVDDSVILRKFVASVMDGIDDVPVELIEAATGPEALTAVEEHGAPIDLMLCDLGIPEIDGLSVLKTVKARPDSGNMTVVMMTGDMSDETVSRALEAGAAGFLVKPFSQDEVTRLVREVHSRRERG